MINAPKFSEYEHVNWVERTQAQIELARTRIAEVKKQNKADFSSILALETADEELCETLEVFYGLLGTDSNDEREALAQKLGPINAAFASEISQDEDLFALINRIWEGKDALGLDTEQMSVLEKHWKGFVRNGALLDASAKARLKEIDAKLSTLGPSFSDNARKSAKAFTLLIEDEAKLAGLPAGAIAAAKAEAEGRGKKEAWVFTLDYPSYVPFMTYADERPLREQMWRAFGARAFGDDFDNSANINDIVRLRHERAALLGFNSHAHYVLERRMAGTPARVMTFLERLRDVGIASAKGELAALKDFAKDQNGPDVLKPWDIAYYSEKLKQDKYQFDSEALRAYFPVDAVLKGCFAHCEKLYGISFQAAPAYESYHKDAQVFEVVDQQSGQALGLLFADFFPRGGKRAGAWQGTFRERRIMRDGKVALPISSIVCNFTKPTKDTPSLLSFDEVETLFHEMGHALHTLLTKVDYPSISGTSVYWDFVELPSQLMENWLYEQETLDMFARHYQTGAPIPAELIKGLKASQNFMAGWGLLRQVQFCLLDMAWHSAAPNANTDVSAFEQEVLKDLALLPYEGGCVSTSFAHIFAGGYSAGYYSYQWAEVLDADAFAAFQDKGLYDTATAQAFRQNVLERGGAEPPLELFRRFRGRAPDADASLRRKGLL